MVLASGRVVSWNLSTCVCEYVCVCMCTCVCEGLSQLGHLCVCCMCLYVSVGIYWGVGVTVSVLMVPYLKFKPFQPHTGKME